jgi:hypothetical protein
MWTVWPIFFACDGAMIYLQLVILVHEWQVDSRHQWGTIVDNSPYRKSFLNVRQKINSNAVNGLSYDTWF